MPLRWVWFTLPSPSRKMRFLIWQFPDNPVYYGLVSSSLMSLFSPFARLIFFFLVRTGKWNYNIFVKTYRMHDSFKKSWVIYSDN